MPITIELTTSKTACSSLHCILLLDIINTTFKYQNCELPLNHYVVFLLNEPFIVELAQLST